MGVAGAVAGTFGIQPLVGAFGVPYLQAAEPMDERQIRVPLRNSSEMSQGDLLAVVVPLMQYGFSAGFSAATVATRENTETSTAHLKGWPR